MWRVSTVPSRAAQEKPISSSRASSTRGEPSSRGVQLEPRPAAEEANAPWAGFHTFRHTCASLLFERGANAKQVQRWLGHHSPSFTLDTYVHLLDERLPEPVDLGAELLAASAQAERRSPSVRSVAAEAPPSA